jgi:hypothetical protein
MLDGETLVQAISVRGYRKTALREAARICARPTLFESWVLNVSAYRLRRIRDDQITDCTEVQQPDPAAAKHTSEKESTV